MFWFFKKKKASQEPVHPAFNIASTYDKLYAADGKESVTLTPFEADELLSYIQYITWLTNPPKKK